MDVRKMACMGAAAFVGSLLLTATVSFAQPGRPVVVEKHLDATTRYVPFTDLSLTTKEGKRALYHRVDVAVQEVCPPVEDGGFNLYDVDYCRLTAWDGARPQISQAIRSAQSGAALAMSIEVSAASK